MAKTSQDFFDMTRLVKYDPCQIVNDEDKLKILARTFQSEPDILMWYHLKADGEPISLPFSNNRYCAKFKPLTCPPVEAYDTVDMWIYIDGFCDYFIDKYLILWKAIQKVNQQE